eukprot:ctg_7256.g537
MLVARITSIHDLFQSFAGPSIQRDAGSGGSAPAGVVECTTGYQPMRDEMKPNPELRLWAVLLSGGLVYAGAKGLVNGWNGTQLFSG